MKELEETVKKSRNMYMSTNKDEIYHIGIIDYIQLWNSSKKLENFFKTNIQRADSLLLSAVRPDIYLSRFMAFVVDDFLMSKAICPVNDRSCGYLKLNEAAIKRLITQ